MFGFILDILISFMVSVAAGVVTYYICNWLNRRKEGKQPKV